MRLIATMSDILESTASSYTNGQFRFPIRGKDLLCSLFFHDQVVAVPPADHVGFPERYRVVVAWLSAWIFSRSGVP
jgi:hypothetical protein